ncbi:MAG: peptide deformylase [Candidatus Harrisonbacteria bacterium]|nr:peptide deformylase [Candidatus Harrisonbacteria bacterium]
MEKILNKENKDEETFLHQKVKSFDFSLYSAKEIKELISTMRRIMIEKNGIGLAANQIGLDLALFVARDGKDFYAVFNPRITKEYGEKVEMEEGCLSVPGYQGRAKRYEKVLLEGQDARGKKLKIKAWGLLAHIFQHETDHLKGILYTDHAQDITKLEKES